MSYNKPPFVRCFLILIVILFIFTQQSSGQSYNKTSNFRSYWQIVANGGTSLFFGDIKQYQFAPVSNYENEWRFGAGVMLVKQVSPIFGIRGQFLYGSIAGTRRARNLFFESNYLEFNLNTSIGIRNMFKKYKSDQFWNAYVLLGIGLTSFNTELMELNTKKVIKNVGNGSGKSFGGRTLQGMLMGGIGLDFRISSRVNINLETANRILNTDELDGSTGGFKYDVYNYTSFGVSYKFGGRTEKSKKSEDYSYFKSDEKDENISTTDYDYNPNKPISPPEVDALTIEPVIFAIPVTTPPSVQVVEEVVVEVIPETSVVEYVVKMLEYRVQIRAKYGKPISVQHLSDIYNIPINEIQEDTYNGFYIYTVGSFTTYEQARERRNYVRTHNGVIDSFVVAFRNGERLNKLP